MGHSFYIHTQFLSSIWACTYKHRLSFNLWNHAGSLGTIWKLHLRITFKKISGIYTALLVIFTLLYWYRDAPWKPFFEVFYLLFLCSLEIIVLFVTFLIIHTAANSDFIGMMMMIQVKNKTKGSEQHLHKVVFSCQNF